MGAWSKEICTHDGFSEAKINIIIEEIPFCCSNNLTKLDNGKICNGILRERGRVSAKNTYISEDLVIIIIQWNIFNRDMEWTRTNIAKLSVSKGETQMMR